MSQVLGGCDAMDRAQLEAEIEEIDSDLAAWAREIEDIRRTLRVAEAMFDEMKVRREALAARLAGRAR